MGGHWLTHVVSTEVKDDSIYWTQERFAKLGVKGSFLPLSVQPKNVGLADWLAHKCKQDQDLELSNDC